MGQQQQKEGPASAAKLQPENVFNNPLAAHPLEHEANAAPSAAENAAVAAPSRSSDASSGLGGTGEAGAAPGNQQQGEFQTHLRKMTASLMDILDQMSGKEQQSGGSSSGSSSSGRDLPGNAQLARRHTTIGARGDSVATIVDLEAGGTLPRGTADEGSVPVQHVRRLTTTLVDILRHVAASGQQGQQGQHSRSASQMRGDCEITPLEEGRGLLAPDNASEMSYGDDKLSLSSAGTASSASQADSRTALLRAQFMQEEYTGDEVKPFYVDNPAYKPPPAEAVEDPSDPSKPSVASAETEDYDIPHRLQKQRRINYWGTFVFVTFMAAFGFYIWARATKTLGLGGNLWYGAIVLAVEILGGIAMLPYGLCLTMRVINNTAPPPDDKGQVASKLPYHVRVIIPCYKEPLEVVQKTVLASLYAQLPSGCSHTVYLLDDGRDAEKKKFIHSLGMHNAVYVSGRKRAKAEMNGKSANINNAARQVYPEGYTIPLTEVLCVFDADQVPNADFFLKTVPLLDGGQDVGMVLSPQTFYNLNANGDIFNHANVHFWDYTQLGYDALGLISCTGTNFLIRARAFQQGGWFPEWTLTEDFALGIELKKLKWQCRYVNEYLAIGEAPDDVRNCFQQRSRWAKGHFQVFFSRHNPIFTKGLSLLMRWLYGSVILSYFSAFTSTPLLMLVPIITIWFGSFPIVINFWAAISITIYYAATTLLMYYTRAMAHLKSMWFASVANSILWFAFLKAIYRATIGRWIAGAISFKVTAKGLQRLADLPIRDVWMSALFFVFGLVSLIFGMVHFFRGALDTPLAISLIFMIYNLIPHYLLLQYAVYNKPMVFNAICRLMMLLSTLAALFGVVLVWVLYPRSYNYYNALGECMFFFDSQRVGVLPANNTVAWRGNAFGDDYNATVYLASSMSNDTFGGAFGQSPDSFGAFGDPFGRRLLQNDPFASASGDPFAAFPSSGGSGSGGGSGGTGSLGGSNTLDPFASSSNPAPAGPTQSEEAWDLGGGWMSGMAGGNIKATSPVAFTTTLLVWALMTFGSGFENAGQTSAALSSIRWGSDYLLKVHRASPDANSSMLVTRVGDIDTEMMLWYRPEDSASPRPAYAVDLTTGGSDLGGSVAAALAASSALFQAQNDTEYAAQLLDKAKEVYDFSRAAYGKFTDGDFNATLLYNSSTLYDDLAWAAGWLYKATKQDVYLSDMYDFYVKHLREEAVVADWKFAFDWDNVFWPLNLLLAQETAKGTFHQQTEHFLRNWICANNAANYTTRGRAYNPLSGSLGATANAAFMSLMYSDMVQAENPQQAQVYKCWGLSQVRYMLGDSGQSLMVGHGSTAPQRTQDRAAACPDPPAVCNRVTGLLSPDPDTHVLTGALVYGSGRSDAFADIRSADSNWVGVENNAGFAGALAGAAELPDGLWEVCLQQYGIVRDNPVCGSFINI